MSTRPPYPIDYRFADADYGARRERFPGDKLLIPLVEACLESGMTSSEAVKFAIECQYAIDQVARVEDDGKNLPPFSEIVVVRRFLIAAVRSGACGSAFVAASRAVGTWRELKKAGRALRKDWLADEKRDRERADAARYKAKVGAGEADVVKIKRRRGRPRKYPRPGDPNPV